MQKDIKQFNLFTSNRMEILAEALADVLKTPLTSPLTPELVVVQSKGMERWLSMALARQHGICANIRFPFPNAFVYVHIFRAVLPDLPDASPFDPQVMTWKIMGLLPACLPDPVFGQLTHYLGGAGTGIKTYQLSSRIADTFDQYLLFRPEMILAWEARRQKNGWQSALWRKLTEGESPCHRAALGRSLIDALEKSPEAARHLPERISVFGISTLPRFHMKVFDAISRHRQVNLFLMNPCADYWGDLLSRQEERKVLRRGSEKGVDREDLHLGERNSFLASMGMLGRDFFDLINEFDAREETFFVPPGEETLLSCIQSDILHRRDRPSEQVPVKPVTPADTSVVIHSCHSPMRETEVLHDNLLALFDEDPTLTPGDVLVMTPDIETYAPYIQAVFDVPSGESRRIPFSIADRGVRMESRVIDTFLSLLDLAGSRFGAARVLSVLETPAVCRKFDLTQAHLDRVRQWVRDTRIRWGVDGQNRAGLGLPEMRENTWRAGLDRLLLGYAMTGSDERMFRGILPYDAVEGSEAVALGQLLEFTDRLFTQINALSRPRRLREWAGALGTILDSFFQPDEETEGEIQIVRDTLGQLAETEARSGFGEKVDLSVIKAHLGARLRKDLLGFGFITGGVTFCAMLPMRSIPFRVICLIGMNSDAYPRQSKPPGFDLMAKDPRLGDRSGRNDDRYLFLEAMLSARQKLYISYVGQNIRDNSAIPPSVLVSELTDYIARGFELPGRDLLRDHILTSHRLQAFSPAYFQVTEDAGKLFSYSAENCRAARSLLENRKAREAFISKGLPDPDGEWKTVDLGGLCSFFGNPARFLLNRRLGIYLEDENGAVGEKEFFEVGGLDKYKLAHNLLEKRLEGRRLKNFFPVRKQAGDLPHGTVGQCIYEKVCREVEAFAEQISPYVAADHLEPLEVDLKLNGFRLTGRLTGIYPDRLVRYRCTGVKPKDQVGAWIQHLVLNCSVSGTYPKNTLVAGTDALWGYLPVETGADLLEKLLKIYWQGLKRPLRFFPRSAWVYAEQRITKNKSEQAALNSALNKWKGNQYKNNTGEMSDHYFERCFGDTDPLNDEFRGLAVEILRPLFEYREKI